ncbi:MAG: tetratricopeptide repeat protein [Phycisphaerae bacterium]
MAETENPNADQPQGDEPVEQPGDQTEAPRADESQPGAEQPAEQGDTSQPDQAGAVGDAPRTGETPAEKPEGGESTDGGEAAQETSPEAPDASAATEQNADTSTPEQSEQAEVETRQASSPAAQPQDGGPAAASADPETSAAGDQSSASSEESDATGGSFDASTFLQEHETPLHKRIPLVPLLLGFNTLVVCFLLAVIVFVVTGGSGSPDEASAYPSDESAAVNRPHRDEGESSIEPPNVEPQAWLKAERAFANQDFTKALGYYRHLLEAADGRPVDAFVVDYLRLRSGDCLVRLGRSDEGRELLERVSSSGSPIVRAVSNYLLAELELRTERYPAARRRAYTAVAALGAIEREIPLQRDCDYLVARCLTESAMRFYNPDESIPWPGHNASDPFTGLDDSELRSLLHDGAERMAESVLGPEVSPARRTDAARLWSVSCWQATLEEVLYRFASACDMNVHWASAAPPVRRRGVSLAFREVGEHRLFEVACGMAGLVARFQRDEVEVHDPDAVSSLSNKRELLKAEAVSMWRRFFLRASDDRRLPVGHFALGRLYELAGETSDAMREYRLTAGRFPRHELAPRALLRKARMQISLRDYAGARADLMDLLDMYPDYPAVDSVYLYLGRSALNTGLWDEAIRTFRKLYYLELTKASRLEACRGVARSYFEKGNYSDARKWYERYFQQSDDPSGEEPAEAFHTWGRCEEALGNVDKAAAAYKLSLGAGGPTGLRTRASLDLAQSELQRQNFLAALAILNDLDAGSLDDEQNYTRLRLQARALREMGLPLRARRMLSRHMPEVSDSHHRGMLTVELAKCLVDEDKCGEARDVLANSLGEMRPGPESHEAALYLGRLCLEDKRYRQAAEVARTLLDSSATGHIRRQVQELLGMARAYERDYEGAAEAFSADADGFSGDMPDGGREPTP